MDKHLMISIASLVFNASFLLVYMGMTGRLDWIWNLFARFMRWILKKFFSWPDERFR